MSRTDGKSEVNIEMTMTSPACPAGPQLLGQSKEFVSKLDDVSEVDVNSSCTHLGRLTA